MTSMNSVLETRALIRSRLGAPDVYPQDPKQKEDELTNTNVKIGFTYSIPGIGENIEYGSAARCHIDTNKLNDSFNEILWHKQKKNTYPDIANSVNKKRPGLTKENFFLVQLTKNRGYVSQWIKDLKNGKALSHIAKRVPIYGKKEEIFQALAEQQVAIVRASWFIKMTAQYFVLQADAKNKKNRTTVDHNPEWTTAICRFMKEQLSRLLDDQSLNHPGMLGIQHVLDETERHYEYMSKLANYMYAEGMLDRHDFLSWIVETMERMRAHGTHALTYIMPLVMKHVQDIVKNQLLSRRLAFVCCRLLSWLLNDSTWGSNTNRSNAIESPSPLSVGPPSVSGPQSQKQLSAPPTPGQMSKPLSPPKLGQNMNSANMAPRALPTNFPTFLEDIAYGLICIVQCITMDCPGALVWYPPEDTNRVPGSPLDYLPVAPSLLPLPSKSEKSSTSEDAALRSKLHEMQNDIIQRSYAAEMRWSSDKCQESVTGQAINRLLSTLEVLDKQQNFDRTEPIDSIYYKIFAHSNSSKDGNDQVSQTGDEAVICLLCEWAVSAQRLGEHRAAVVAKLLDKRQALLEQEQAIAAAEKAKVLNTSNPTTSSSNPGSVGTILSPPQLLVEGTEPLHNEQAINQPLAASGIAPNNIPIFQELLFNFLDTQAPELVDPFNKKELQSFKNLVMLFSELVQHDVFSHDEYVNTLISKGEITPGVISPLPIFNQASTSSATLNASTGYNNHSSVGAISIPSVEPRSVGAPVSNRAMDLMAKTDFDDDFPSSARSIDHKTDGDLMCSPTVSPFGTSMTERHFTDVMKSMPDNSKDKMPLLSSSGYYKKVVGPIWGYGQRRHVQYLMHLPIPFEDDDCVHEMNQRMMVLYGAARQRTEVKKEVKKISKYVCKLIQKPPSLDNNYTGPSSVKSSSGSSSKKSKNRNSDGSTSPVAQTALPLVAKDWATKTTGLKGTKGVFLKSLNMDGPNGKAKDNEVQAKCTRKDAIKIDFIKMPDGIIQFCAPPKSFTKSKNGKKKSRVHPHMTQKVEEVDDISKLMQKMNFASSRHKAISSRRNAQKHQLKATAKPKPSLFKDSSLCKFVAHRGFPRKTFTPTIRPLDYPARDSGTSHTGRHQNICLMSGYNSKSFEEVRCEDYLAGWKGSVSASHRGPEFKPKKDDWFVHQVITASPEYADCSLEELRMEYYMPSIAWKHRQSYSISSSELKKLPVTIGSTVYVFMNEDASKHKGTIRYIGRLPKKPWKETFAGIEFEEKCGLCDGCHGGVRFFRTKERCAEFIPIDSVLPEYMIKKTKTEKTEPSTSHSDDAEGIRCSICLEHPIKIIFLPCGHYVTCVACSKKVDTCPICRKKIATKQRVYVSGS